MREYQVQDGAASRFGLSAAQARCSLIAAAALIIGGVAVADTTFAADAGRQFKRAPLVSEGAPVTRVTVTLHKSRTFNVERAFARAIVGSVEFADVLPLSDRAIYIQGKKPGTTNVSLFDNDARLIGVLDLEVVLDTGNLQQKVRASGAGARGIRVGSVQDQIVLSGVAADAVAADRALQVAKSIAGDREIVNAMQVAPTQQVMLEVRFLEVSRDAGRKLGVNWFGANNSGTHGARTGSDTAVGVNPITPTTPSGIPIFQTLGTLVGSGTGVPFGTFVARALTTDNARIDLVVTALEEKGLVRRLAEPNLIALSGETARFHAGGEFPVPVPRDTQGGVPTIAIEYKPFGVRLSFTPTVLSRGVINLRIAPEVSELNFNTPVTIAGTQVPSLVKRDAQTSVELRDGQSFAIAGLLQSNGRRNLTQLPWIGSVPVLGALFRSAAFQEEETDLVIIVTPRLVAPAVPGQRLASPLDSRMPSNDVDFFLMGQPELKKEYTDYISHGGRLKGPYGHIIAPEPGGFKPVKKK